MNILKRHKPKFIATLITTGAILFLTGCQLGKPQPIRDLGTLNGQTFTVNTTQSVTNINGIETPAKLSFNENGEEVNVKSLKESTDEDSQLGKTYYYVTISKKDLIKELPKNDNLNGYQYVEFGKENQEKQAVKEEQNYVKKQKTDSYVILAPEKYKDYQDFKKNAPSNGTGVANGHGYEVYAIQKDANTITLVELQSASQSTKELGYKYQPLKLTSQK